MSDAGIENFFEGAASTGAPSASLKNIGDYVHGEIVEQFKVEAKKFGTDEVELDKKTGEPIKQLVVILQTTQRNWQGVARVPLTDPTDRNSAPKDPSEDDGRRALYIKPWTNLHGAVAKALQVAKAGKGLQNGGTLGVKITDLEDRGKGNPLKVHQAVYEAPAASSGDFFAGGAPASAPAPAASAPAPAAPATNVEEPPF